MHPLAWFLLGMLAGVVFTISAAYLLSYLWHNGFEEFESQED